MTVFALGSTILLVSMGTGHQMGYTNLAKKGIKFLILATLISLDGNNFSIKSSLN
jgi:hypothetical protein